MPCLFDSRWIGQHGIGRFARELHARLAVNDLAASGRPMSPTDTLHLSAITKKYNKNDWLLSPGYNAPLISNIPYVFSIHDLNHIDRPDNSSLLKRLYYNLILRRLCQRSRAILTVSEYSRERIAEWSGVQPYRIFNVGNGVSKNFSPEGRRYELDGGYLLCVSNRRGHKNETGMVQAFARARLPGNTKLVFTGEASPNLLELAENLEIANRLVFTGKVSEDDLAALYRGALFLVFPSFYEGFGLPIIEAFASGTPVITSNVTSMPEIAGDAALLVDPNDVNDIATAIEKLYDSEELRTELIQRGFKRVANFTWDAVADRVKAAVKAVDTDPSHPLSWN